MSPTIIFKTRHHSKARHHSFRVYSTLAYSILIFLRMLIKLVNPGPLAKRLLTVRRYSYILYSFYRKSKSNRL